MNLILILLVLGFAYFMWKRYNGKPFKYILGSSLILIGIIFIEPSPDFLSFGLYCVTHGLAFSSMNAGNISSILFTYELWSIPIGIISVLSGMWLLGWSWQRLWKKLNIDRFWLCILFAALVVGFVAYLDIQGMIYWTSFSTAEAYTLGQQGMAFWEFFKSIAFVLFLITPLIYFWFIKSDWSETIAIFTSEVILFMTGFSDLIYFFLLKTNIPDILPWLNNHIIIGTISKFLGYSQVTNVSLLFSVMVGIIAVYLTAKILKEKF